MSVPDKEITPTPIWIIGLIQGVLFAVLWGPAMYFFSWKEIGTSIKTAVMFSVIAGAVFGGAMAIVTFIRRRRHNSVIRSTAP